MSSPRHVPLISGLVSLAIAFFVLFYFDGFWKYLVFGFLCVYGVVSVKTALYATDQEINELTGEAPMTTKTAQRFRDRI